MNPLLEQFKRHLPIHIQEIIDAPPAETDDEFLRRARRDHGINLVTSQYTVFGERFAIEKGNLRWNHQAKGWCLATESQVVLFESKKEALEILREVIRYFYG